MAEAKSREFFAIIGPPKRLLGQTVRTLHHRSGRSVEELVRRHQDGVRRFLHFLGCPPSMLDDLVQDCFLSVLASDFVDRNPHSTSAYLRKVVRHMYLKAIDRERSQPLRVEFAEAEEAWSEAQGEDEGRGYVTALRECMGLLNGRSKEVLDLRYRTRLKRRTIGERLGLSEAGVHSILVRARRRLRDCVERRVEE